MDLEKGPNQAINRTNNNNIYLNLIISYNKIKMDPKKVAVIINQESPINI